MKALIQHKDPNSTRWMLQALVPFSVLKDSVLFTYRSNPYQQEDNKKGEFLSSKEFYQRRVDSKRSEEIKAFVRRSILQERDGVQMATLFPTSMILSLNVDDEDIKSNSIEQLDDDHCEINIKTNVFIVDGQHRMMGMINLYDELDRLVRTDDDEYVFQYLIKYKFNCTILVNYDLWEQGQVFINVNFKQKPVNKSLYYEIFGAEYRENETDKERNKIYLAHSITRIMNSNPASPYFQRIKMLGTGVGYISQAFMVEALVRLFKPNRLWYFDSEKQDVVSNNYFATELLSFFVAVKHLFSEYWPDKESTKGTIICKTTGTGAWIRMIDMMRSEEDLQMLSSLKKSSAAEEVCKEYVEMVSGILSPLQLYAEKLFGKESEFSSSTGRGAETKLFKKMLFIIENSKQDRGITENQDVDRDRILEQLQDYIWSNSIGDIDSLCHHYDIQDISDFEIESLTKTDEEAFMSALFNINVTLFVDSEDETGFFMQFPAKCNAVFNKSGSNYILNAGNLDLSVDTEKFYQ